MDGFYTVRLVGGDDAGYTVAAEPTGNQRNDVCGAYALNQVGPVYAGYAGPDCWGR